MKTFIKTGENLVGLRQILQDLPDGEYCIKEFKRTRSGPQNRFYWKRLESISECFAERGACISDNELHTAFKEMFIKSVYKKNKLNGKRYKKEKSSAVLKTDGFNKFLQNIDGYLWQTYEMVVLKPTELHYKNI